MVKLRVSVGGSYTDLAIVNCNDEFHPIEFEGPEFKGRAVVRIKDFGKNLILLCFLASLPPLPSPCLLVFILPPLRVHHYNGVEVECESNRKKCYF